MRYALRGTFGVRDVVNQTVLLVDDDALGLAFLQRVMEKHGYRTFSAGNGKDALEIQKREQCQIVISDWEMGEMSGLDLCAALRQSEDDQYVYVILLTGRGDYESRLQAYETGVDDFISKPFRPAELLGHLRVAERVISLQSADTTIFALAKLAESRDKDTGKHLERVQQYSRILASKALAKGLFPDELNAAFVRLIYETSPLHDIGKVAISDAVLLKPEKLTPEEFEIMKSHTTRGAETLGAALERRPGARFLRVAKQIAESHHEKWDGSGYPSGLKGEAIPLAGRIVAIADVFDALSTKRVYKPSMPLDEVIQRIREGSGQHFDPVLVEVFVECAPQFMEVAKALAADAA